MTKPIEGWVAWHSDCGVDDALVDDNLGNEPYRIIEVHKIRASLEREIKQAGWIPRPVRITFTDEPSNEVADAIRKERERIWEIFVDSDFFWCASDEMEPEVFQRELGDFKRAIFGEEK